MTFKMFLEFCNFYCRFIEIYSHEILIMTIFTKSLTHFNEFSRRKKYLNISNISLLKLQFFVISTQNFQYIYISTSQGLSFSTFFVNFTIEIYILLHSDL